MLNARAMLPGPRIPQRSWRVDEVAGLAEAGEVVTAAVCQGAVVRRPPVAGLVRHWPLVGGLLANSDSY